MAQLGFILQDEGRNITVLNDSGTTAITAGDLVFSIANDNVLGTTAAAARNSYAGGDIRVKPLAASATGYQTPIGVALQDIPADGTGNVALEGVWMHKVSENVEAGNPVQFAENTSQGELQLMDVATTSGALTEGVGVKVGRALTGGTADGQYIIWKLTL
jgi:predicted RecA/RadA family phage recombinase